MAIVQTRRNEEQGSTETVRLALEGVLSGGNDVERCLAVRAAGLIEGAGDVDVLVRHLHDADPDVRADVAVALGRIGEGAAIGPLLDNLREDPVSDLKVLYVRALRELGASQAVDLFCLLALGRAEEHGVVWEHEYGGWDDWLDVQVAVIEAMGEICPASRQEEGIETILTALHDPEGQELWAVSARALARMGDEGIVALGRLYSDATPLQCKRIATALDDTKSGAASKLLEIMSRHRDRQVRLAVVEACRKRGSPGQAMALLGDEDADVRRAVLQGFDGFDDKDIRAALMDRDAGVKIAACGAIERVGRINRAFDLVRRTERSLRKAPADVLAALIGACAVAEPEGAALLVRDVVNHDATASQVRLACLRALPKLDCPDAAEILQAAATDERQEIRLAAIAALGDIARYRPEQAEAAIAVLGRAICGDLAEAPAGWQPEEDNVIAFQPAPGRKEDSVSRSVKLDREGNIIEPGENCGAAAELPGDAMGAPGEEGEVVPLSTLEAILETAPAPRIEESGVELTGEDLAMMKLTASRPGRRHVSPQSSVPVHLDVSRLAARVSGETGRKELVAALAGATFSLDAELSLAALDALGRMAGAGTDVSAAEPELLQLSRGADQKKRAGAVGVLGFLSSSQSAEAIAQALRSDDVLVRAVAVRAAGKRPDITIDLAGLKKDARQVRLAGAQIAVDRGAQGLAYLLEVCRAEDGVHKHEVARIMKKGVAGQGAEALLSWIRQGDPRDRLLALEMLPVVLSSGHSGAGEI